MSEYQRILDHLTENQYVWLVTGVAGFIGSNLLEALLKLNQKIIGLDNFATGYPHNMAQAIADAGLSSDTNLFRFIEGDICNLDVCKAACLEVDFVLHQAALGSVPRSIEDPIRTNQANIVGFLNMLVAARDTGVKRFIYAASSSTYGDHPDLPKVEDTIGGPLSPYAVTKYVNELYAEVFARTYDIEAVGLRYFNIFGKRQDPGGAYAAVIPKWISAVMQGEQVYINGDGETSRDFCYVENAIQMNLLSALTKNKDAINQVFNVALNDQTSLNQLHAMIVESLGNKLRNLQKREPIYRDFRKGDVKHSRADISKAQRLLGYAPTHRIKSGMAKTVDFFFAKIEADRENKA